MTPFLIDLAREIAYSIQNKEISIFCGAGISKHSGFPLANDLKEYILKKLIKNKKDISKIMKSNFPFEAFMEAVAKEININKILSMFEEGNPNANHILIAKLVKLKYIKRIFTTNFDLLIEKALENEGLIKNKDFFVYYKEEQFSNLDFKNLSKEKIVKIFKLHGSAENKDSIRTTLRSISSKTLYDKRIDLTRYLFSENNSQTVLILGYSCSDEFDITPQIQSLKGKRNKITLIEHSRKIQKIKDINEVSFKNPFINFKGCRVEIDVDALIKKLWFIFQKPIKEEYQFKKFEDFWKKCVDEWDNYSGKHEQHRKYYVIGNIFNSISKFNVALHYYNRALKITIKLNDKLEQARCLTAIGINYEDIGQPQKAIVYHKKSLVLAKSIKSHTVQSDCYIGLASANHVLKEFVKAIEYYQKVLRIQKKIINNKDTKIRCYIGLGNSYSSSGNVIKGLNYHKKALALANEIGNLVQKSVSNANLGVDYHKIHDYQKAIFHLKNAIEIAKKIGHKSIEAACYSNIGGPYENIGEIVKAKKYYNNAKKLFKVTNQPHYFNKVHDKLIKLNTK